jgi:hypothetical protein
MLFRTHNLSEHLLDKHKIYGREVPFIEQISGIYSLLLKISQYLVHLAVSMALHHILPHPLQATSRSPSPSFIFPPS